MLNEVRRRPRFSSHPAHGTGIALWMTTLGPPRACGAHLKGHLDTYVSTRFGWGGHIARLTFIGTA
jgi:hypothetical protein